MKWKTFFQVTILIVITAAIFYVVCPKYYFYAKEGSGIRANHITGKVELYSSDHWKTLK